MSYLNIFLTTLFLATTVHAASVPSLINYQGMLTDAQGQPIANDSKKLTFNIYDSATGGTLIWGPQVFTNIPVINGYFNVILGPTETDTSGVAQVEGKPISDAFTGSIDCYLEIQVDTDPVIIPRQQILSAPYAFQAETATMADAVVPQGVTTDMLADGVVDAIGTIKQSLLTESQFQNIRGASWVRMAGQDITGSDLAILTGITTLPNAVAERTFFRQAKKDESDLRSYQHDENKVHEHFGYRILYCPGPGWGGVAGNGGNSHSPGTLKNDPARNRGSMWGQEITNGNESWWTSTADQSKDKYFKTGQSGTEGRPKNYSVNYFIKINK